MAKSATETSGVQQGRTPDGVDRNVAVNEAKERIAEESRERTQAERDATQDVASGAEQNETATSDKLGNGQVSVKYLGTSDRFIVGTNDDGTDVIAYAGGDPVSVTRELADHLMSLPHDKFEETK